MMVTKTMNIWNILYKHQERNKKQTIYKVVKLVRPYLNLELINYLKCVSTQVQKYVYFKTIENAHLPYFIKPKL